MSLGASISVRFPARLGRAEERPFPGRGLELMHPAIIGMKEIRAIGNEVSMRRANRALRPSRAHSGGRSTMLADFNRYLNRIFNLVLNSCGPSGNQPALACLFSCTHGMYPFLFHHNSTPVLLKVQKSASMNPFPEHLMLLRSNRSYRTQSRSRNAYFASGPLYVAENNKLEIMISPVGEPRFTS